MLNTFSAMLNGLLFALLFVFMLPLAGRAQAGPARPDSITAIKRLFRQRRQCGSMGLAVGCGTMAPGASTATVTPETSPMLLSPCTVAGLGPDRSVLSFFSLMRFSCKREKEMLQRLALHQPLPGYVQRALSPVLASN